MSITARGSTFRVAVRDSVVGRIVTATFPTRDRAEAFERLCLLHKSQGIPLPDPQAVKQGGSVGLWVTAAEQIWGDTKDEKTATDRTKALVKWFGENTPITTITNQRVLEFVEDCKRKNNANSTINRKLSCLSMLLQHSKSAGVITEIPDIPRFKESQGRIRFLTENEKNLVFQTFKLFRDDEAIAATKFLLAQGNRCGEAMRTRRNSGQGYPLEWKDVSEPWGTAPQATHIDKKTGEETHYPIVTFWLTKNGNPRTLPLLKPAQEALEFTKSLGWSKPFEGITYQQYYYKWQRMRDHIGMSDDEDFVPHVLRHTVASDFVMRGHDLKRVQEWLGHNTIQTTMRYAHLAPSSLFTMIPDTELVSADAGPASHLTVVK